jgi:hypothetical protein
MSKKYILTILLSILTVFSFTLTPTTLAYRTPKSGYVNNRSQFNNSSSKNWTMRNSSNGRFTNQKTSSNTPFVGVKKYK